MDPKTEVAQINKGFEENEFIANRVREWDRAMNRAFKGIYPGNERRKRLLRRAR